jgi:hypothetical protein
LRTSGFRACPEFGTIPLYLSRYSLRPARCTGVEVRKPEIVINIYSMSYVRTNQAVFRSIG